MKEYFLDAIHGSKNWRSCKKLTLGWSSDEKYVVETDSGKRLLLRVAGEESFSRKRAEYEFLQSVEKLPLTASRPVDFGRFPEGVYTLYSWVEGVSMESALPSLSPARQYELGMEAGKALRLIHSLPAPSEAENWSVRMNRKMDRKIRMALDCPIEIPGRDWMIAHIQEHRRLLDDRPQTMQHGDFHCGNLLLTPDDHVGIIDFNRFDVGDPWEEFNRIVWCAQASGPFASGRVNGYFENVVPADFFPLLNLYIFSNQLSSLPWAIPFGQQEIDVMLCQSKEVSRWYDDGARDLPTWYLSPRESTLL